MDNPKKKSENNQTVLSNWNHSDISFHLDHSNGGSNKITTESFSKIKNIEMDTLDVKLRDIKLRDVIHDIKDLGNPTSNEMKKLNDLGFKSYFSNGKFQFEDNDDEIKIMKNVVTGGINPDNTAYEEEEKPNVSNPIDFDPLNGLHKVESIEGEKHDVIIKIKDAKNITSNEIRSFHQLGKLTDGKYYVHCFRGMVALDPNIMAYEEKEDGEGSDEESEYWMKHKENEEDDGEDDEEKESDEEKDDGEDEEKKSDEEKEDEWKEKLLKFNVPYMFMIFFMISIYHCISTSLMYKVCQNVHVANLGSLVSLLTWGLSLKSNGQPIEFLKPMGIKITRFIIDGTFIVINVITRLMDMFAHIIISSIDKSIDVIFSSMDIFFYIIWRSMDTFYDAVVSLLLKINVVVRRSNITFKMDHTWLKITIISSIIVILNMMIHDYRPVDHNSSTHTSGIKKRGVRKIPHELGDYSVYYNKYKNTGFAHYKHVDNRYESKITAKHLLIRPNKVYALKCTSLSPRTLECYQYHNPTKYIIHINPMTRCVLEEFILAEISNIPVFHQEIRMDVVTDQKHHLSGKSYHPYLSNTEKKFIFITKRMYTRSDDVINDWSMKAVVMIKIVEAQNKYSIHIIERDNIGGKYSEHKKVIGNVRLQSHGKFDIYMNKKHMIEVDREKQLVYYQGNKNAMALINGLNIMEQWLIGTPPLLIK